MKYIIKLLKYINVAIIIGMVATGFADHLNPVVWGWLAEAGYAYPLFLALNIAMTLVWIFLRFRCVWIPVVGMVVCYVPTSNYSPISMPHEVPDSCLRVMSYNTWNFGSNYAMQNGLTSEEVRKDILRYINEKNVDIVCLQEANLFASVDANINEIMGDRLAYRDSVCNGTNCIILLSRYPIKSKERIEYASHGNLSAAFTIDMDGREVIVVNNHLETNSFSKAEKENFSDVIHGNQGKKAIAHESRYILDKLANAAKTRAPQAEAVASFIRMHKGMPMIVCGDFNDIPISYTHRIIAAELTDTYTAAGWGPGYSYCNNSMRVRIDNILCSDHFTPIDSEVDGSIPYSDHYPIISAMRVD